MGRKVASFSLKLLSLKGIFNTAVVDYAILKHRRRVDTSIGDGILREALFLGSVSLVQS